MERGGRGRGRGRSWDNDGQDQGYGHGYGQERRGGFRGNDRGSDRGSFRGRGNRNAEYENQQHDQHDQHDQPPKRRPANQEDNEQYERHPGEESWDTRKDTHFYGTDFYGKRERGRGRNDRGRGGRGGRHNSNDDGHHQFRNDGQEHDQLGDQAQAFNERNGRGFSDRGRGRGRGGRFNDHQQQFQRFGQGQHEPDFGDDSQADQASFFERRGGRGEQREEEMPSISKQSKAYIADVAKALENDDTVPLDNVWSELKGQEVLATTSGREAAVSLETIVEHSSPFQVRKYLEAFKGNFWMIAFHTTGCRVIEKALKRIGSTVPTADLMEDPLDADSDREEIDDDGDKNTPKVLETVEFHIRSVNRLIDDFASEMEAGEGGWVEILLDNGATHLLRCLCDSLLNPSIQPEGQFRTLLPLRDQIDRLEHLVSTIVGSSKAAEEALRRQKEELEAKQQERDEDEDGSEEQDMHQRLAELSKGPATALDLPELSFHLCASPTIQTLVAAIAAHAKSSPDRKLRSRAKTLVLGLVEKILKLTKVVGSSDGEKTVKTIDAADSDEAKYVDNMLSNRIASHMADQLIKITGELGIIDNENGHTNGKPSQLFNVIYRRQFRHNLAKLAADAQANWVVQNLIAFCPDAPVCAMIVEELLPIMENLLSPARAGVIMHMLASTVRLNVEKLFSPLYKNMLKITLEDPVRDRRLFVPKLFERLKGNAPGFFGGEGRGSGSSHKKKKEVNEFSLASRLLQHLIDFPVKYAQIISNSFENLEADTFVGICCDVSGSRLIEALLQKPCSEKNRQKVIKMVLGHCLKIALTKFGSRCLDVMFRQANIANKERITAELATVYSELSNSYYGRFALIHCKVEQYKKAADTWRLKQTQTSRKREMFEDILNSDDDAPSSSSSSQAKKQSKNPTPAPQEDIKASKKRPRPSEDDDDDDDDDEFLTKKKVKKEEPKPKKEEPKAKKTVKAPVQEEEEEEDLGTKEPPKKKAKVSQPSEGKETTLIVPAPSKKVSAIFDTLLGKSPAKKPSAVTPKASAPQGDRDEIDDLFVDTGKKATKSKPTPKNKTQ